MGKRLMEIAKKEGIQAQEVCPVSFPDSSASKLTWKL